MMTAYGRFAKIEAITFGTLVDISVGSGTTPATIADTSLETEEARRSVPDVEFVHRGPGRVVARTTFPGVLGLPVLTETGAHDVEPGTISDRWVHAAVDPAGNPLRVEITYELREVYA